MTQVGGLDKSIQDLMGDGPDGQMQFSIENLANLTSQEFSDLVRQELTPHLERNEAVQVISWSLETRPGSGRNSITQKSEAWLSLLVGRFCYRFNWSKYERANDRTTQDSTVNWLHISEAQKFVDAFQAVSSPEILKS